MKLTEFLSIYTKTPTTHIEHDEAPRLRSDLVHQVSCLAGSDEHRKAITQYIQERALKEDAEAIQHLSILLTTENQIFYTLANSSHLLSRLNALQVLIKGGQGEKFKKQILELIPDTLGRYPKLDVFTMIETLTLLGGKVGINGLWDMTKVASLTAQRIAFQRLLKLSSPHESLEETDLANLERWACLPLSAMKSEVKRVMIDGKLGWFEGLPIGSGYTRELQKMIRNIGKIPIELDHLATLPQAWKVEILFRIINLMSDYFDPTEQWSEKWNQPWPIQGVDILLSFNPPWTLAVFKELLSLVQSHLEQEAILGLPDIKAELVKIEMELQQAIQWIDH